MQSADDGDNVSPTATPNESGEPKITRAMVDAALQRIENAGGSLTVWGVLREDKYETVAGDGFYVHIRGIALNADDAHTLAAMAGDSEWVRWHITRYTLVIKEGLPAFSEEPLPCEEFDMGDFLRILAEIPAGATASRLLTGTRRRADGPFVSLSII